MTIQTAWSKFWGGEREVQYKHKSDYLLIGFVCLPSAYYLDKVQLCLIYWVILLATAPSQQTPPP